MVAIHGSRREIAIALTMHNSRVVGYPEVIVNTTTANDLSACRTR
jgi:hypothetical protein